ncbi:MAG: C1 family peptidase, partial [Terracidiphilus sp.]
MRVARGFMLLGMVFLAPSAPCSPSLANTPPSESVDASVTKILVVFNTDPGFTIADRADLSTGLRPVSSRVPSVAALLAKYSASYSRPLFVGTRLRNVHELAIKGDSSLAIWELMRDPNVIYARVSDPDLEAKVAATIDRINSQTGGVWVAGYTIPGIMTPEDRRKLLGLSSRMARPAADSPSQQASDARFSAMRQSLTSGQAPSLPSSFDWRAYNNTDYITPVKNQGSCGSCWAFATTGSVQDEANAYYNRNLGLDLSEQQLLSCANAGTCAAGGYTDQALSYVQLTGLTSEACFPYAGADGVPCSNMCGNPTYWKIASWAWLPGSFYEIHDIDIQIGLLAYGPFANYMEVYTDFYYYVSGIYYPSAGATDESGHAPVVVGFGFAAPPPALNSESDPALYLVEKNSWGASWGENGFFQIFSGAAMDNQYMMGINAPAPPTAQTAMCQDLDGAGHCYWGLGPKPASGCPSTCASSTEYCAYNGSAQAPVACLTSASLIQPVPTVTLTPVESSITMAQSLPMTVTVSGGAGNPTPTGSVTLTSGSYASAAAPLSGGSAAITIPAGSLATGGNTLWATYTPDSSGYAAYATATGTAGVFVT